MCRQLFHLPLQREQHVARLAVEMALTSAAVSVAFVIALVGQVIDEQADFQVVVRLVMQRGVPHGITTQILLLPAHGNRRRFALHGNAAAQCPFAAVKRQAVRRIEPQHVLGRVLAEIHAGADGGIGAAVGGSGVFAVVIGIARAGFPVLVQAARQFQVYPAALQAHGFVHGFCAGRTAVPRHNATVGVARQPGVHRLVFLVGLEQHHFAVEFAAVPRAFPTQFITAPLCGFQGLAVYVVAFARVFENAGIAGIQRLGRRQIERYRAIRHGAPFSSDGMRRAHPRQVLVFLPISVAHAAEQVQAVGDVEAGGHGGGLCGYNGLADFFYRAVVPVGRARQFAAVPRENVVCAVQPAAAPQIVEAFAAVVQSHIKLVFAPEQRIFAFQIGFERPLVVVAVAAPQPAVRHGARCGNVAAERHIAVFRV